MAYVNQRTQLQVRRALEASLAVKGARIFNLLPHDIRDTVLNSNKSVIPFKTKLDQFLSAIPDQPTVHIRKRPALTNSLLDQIPMTMRTL